jgi:L-threonylcarbamoyladenylate synthase
VQTLRLNGNVPDDVKYAADLLRSGGTVAFPTETVYGLGANALDAEAVAKIFAAKQRPAWDPLIVHVAGSLQVGEVADVPESLAERVKALAMAFWPGPLTMLVPRATGVPAVVTAGRALAGVRVPANPVALALLQLARVPVAAPSANVFGHISPTRAEHVLADLDGRIDAVLDGGATEVGVESTVFDPAAMVIYRPGAVTAEAIERMLGVRPELYVAPERTEQVEALPSPGVGIRHYAPRARLVLVDGTEQAIGEAVKQAGGLRVGVMLPEGWKEPAGASARYEWGCWKDPSSLATGLFAGLRSLDAAEVELIICPLPRNDGIGRAVRDRLLKAAREK